MLVVSCSHLCHDGQHLLGVEVAMYFDSVAEKPEGVGEISLIDGGTLTFRLPCKLLVVDDQRDSVWERLHVVFVHHSGFVPTLRLHQPKTESDWLEILTIQVEGVKVLDL